MKGQGRSVVMHYVSTGLDLYVHKCAPVMAAVCINREPLRRWGEGDGGKEGRKKGNGAFSPFPIFIEMLTSVPSVTEAATRTVSTLTKGRDPWGREGKGREGEGRRRGRKGEE